MKSIVIGWFYNPIKNNNDSIIPFNYSIQSVHSIIRVNNSSNHHQNDHPNRFYWNRVTSYPMLNPMIRNFSWIVQYQGSSTIYQMFNQMIIHFLSNSQIHWSYNVYQLMMNGSLIDFEMIINWLIQWPHDPMITWSNDYMIQGSHDPIILLFFFFSVSFLQTYLIVHRYPYTNSNLITTSILHVDQATSRIRRGRHILINRQPKWVH